MADRYWVGGSGNWDATSTTNWSTSSGGSAGASAPTSADNVIFDANSNVGTDPFTVTVAGTTSAPSACNDFTAGSLDGAMTLLMNTSSVLNVYGSMTLPATNFTWSGPAAGIYEVYFLSSASGKTFTTNGVTVPCRLIFSGTGDWTLGSALTTTYSSSSSIQFTQGTFNTGNFNITTGGITITANTLVKAVNLGSSTITLSSSSPFTTNIGTANLTFNAGTSTIVSSAVTSTFSGGGLTFYNVEFSGGAGTKTINGANTYTGQFLVSNAAATSIVFGANQTFTGGALIQATSPTVAGSGFSHTGNFVFTSSAHGTKTINSGQTFQNVTITCPAADGITTASVGAVTVTGTLTTTDGGSTARRVQIVSVVAGSQRTLTVGTNSLINTDFKDIDAAGTASWTFGLGYGDLGNNSGITFDSSTLYWIGGTGNWSDGTKWSTSSGGSAANAVPAPQNSVIFDAASNTGTDPFTVTGNPAMFCNDFSTGGAGGALDGAMTLTMGATARLDCYGSLTLPATNFTVSATSGAAINFSATTTGKTITTNGVSLSGVTTNFNGVGGGWTFGSAMTSNNVLHTAGSVDTGNFNWTVSAGFTTSGTTTRSLSFGSSTYTNASANPFTYTGSNLTFNAGTSQINCSGASPTFAGGGLTFYNVSFTSGSAGSTSISGANTFNNLTQTSRSATGLRILALFANQTVSGTLTLGAANTAIRRILVASDTIGTQRTITLNGTLATLADVDFRDINAAGTVATPWTGTRLGNCLGNANITFSAGKNCYRVGTGNWTATQWSLTSGGSLDVNNFPLAQDTMIFDTNTATGTHTIDASGWNLGSLDCSALNVAVTIASGSISPSFYGNITLDSDVTLTGTGTFDLRGQGTTQTITSAGVSFTQPITINSPSGTVQLLDNTTVSNTVTLTAGTLGLSSGNRTLTCNAFSSNNSNTRSISFGTGNITVTGNNATVWTTSTPTNFSYTGTPTVNLTYSGSVGTRTIQPGVAALITESQVLNFNISAGTDIVTITTNQALRSLNFTGFAGSLASANRTLYGSLTLGSGMTVTDGTGVTTFASTTVQQNITSNGVTFGGPMTINGTQTVQLQDNLTIPSTRTFTLTAGTLNLNSKTLTAGSVSSSNSNTRSINFGTNGVINCEGGWTATTGTGLTTAGRGRIKMSSATDKTFAGGGAVYSGVILDQAGAGTLTITGANTFDDIQNSNATASQITFPASTVTSVKKFTVSGSSGNLVSLRSSSAGTRFTIQTL